MIGQPSRELKSSQHYIQTDLAGEIIRINNTLNEGVWRSDVLNNTVQ